MRELVCWIDELGLLRAVETYVKTPHRRPANFMICRDITHGRSEKRRIEAMVCNSGTVCVCPPRIESR